MGFRFAAVYLVLLCAVLGGAMRASAQEWSEPARLDNYPTEVSGTADAFPQLATDNAGNWVAVWHSIEGVVSARSNDLGVTWTPKTVVWNQPNSSVYDFSSDIVYAGNNTWVTTWLPSVDSAFAYAAFSTDLGQTWSTPQRLEDSTVSEQIFLEPRGLATNGNGIVMVRIKGALFRSTDFGQTWSAIYPIADLELTDFKMDYAGGDRWVLMSPRLTSPEHAVFTFVSDDNGLTWSESEELYIGDELISIKSLAASGDNIAMVKTELDGTTFLEGELGVLVSTNGGETFTSTSLDITLGSPDGTTYDIKALPDGTWMIIHGYDSISGNNIYDGDITVYTASAPAGPYTKLADVANNPDIREAGPALEMDTQGNMVMMYAAAPPHQINEYASNLYDVYATHSTNGGLNWSAPSLVSQDDSDLLPLNDTDVTIAAGGDGVMIAVWENTTPLQPREQIVMARSMDSGVTWSTPVALGPGIEPRVLYIGQGRWMTWWQDRNDHLLPKYKLSDDNGLTWSAEPEIFYGYTTAGSSHGTAIKAMALYAFGQGPQFELARLARGTTSWSDYQAFPDRLRAIVHSGGSNWFVTTYDGSSVYASFDDGITWTKLAAANLPQGNVEFASDHAGTVLAVYPTPSLHDPQELVVSKSTDNGLSWTQPLTIASAPDLVVEELGVPFMTIFFNPQRFAAVKATSIGNGGWVVSWQSNPASGPSQIHASFTTDGGENWSAPELAGTYGSDWVADAHGMAADATNVVVAWPFYDGHVAPGSFNGPFVDLLYSFQSVSEAVESDPAADLLGEWGLVETECKTTKKGQKCKLKAQIFMANVGDMQASTKSVVRFYLSDNPLLDPADIELKSKKLPKLKPGKSKNQKVKLKADQPFTGNYLIAVLDADGQVDESSEFNNMIMTQPLQ